LRGIADSGRIVVISTHDDRLGEVADRVVQMRSAATRGQPHKAASELVLQGV
jgi:ABC-type lipoprotein export system ATPase subunit